MDTKGFIIQSRMPLFSPEWEPCRLHGITPEEGFTLQEAARRASVSVNQCPFQSVEIQWRILDPEGNEVALETNLPQKPTS